MNTTYLIIAFYFLSFYGFSIKFISPQGEHKMIFIAKLRLFIESNITELLTIFIFNYFFDQI